MAKITVVSTTNSIKVDMGDYGGGTPVEESKGVWRKDNVTFKLKSTFVEVDINQEKTWLVSNVEDLPNGVLQIDSVDTVAPSSLADLYTKLEVLLA
jgi:hypothetical protein